MKIVIAGNYGAKNIGDELILEGLIKMLQENFPNPEITVLSADPKETEKTHNVFSVPKFPSGFRSILKSIFTVNKTKKAVKACDYFILGGGGLFSNLSTKAYLIWGIQGFMAYLFKKPIIMYGQSVGPLKGRFKKWLVRKVFSKSIFITVRDEHSKKELKKTGITKKIYVMPDMIFRIPPSSEKSLPKRSKQVLIALRYLKRITPSFVQEIANFLNWLSQKKYQLIFLDFQKGSDHLIHQEIINRLDTKNYQHLSEVKNAHSLFKLFQQSEFIIGMRLHSILTAIKIETPFIAINYAPKVENFLTYAKLNHYLLDTDDLRLKEHYSSLQKNFSQIEQELKDFNKKALVRHSEVEKELVKIVT